MERKDFLKNSLAITGISSAVIAACKKEVTTSGSDTTSTTGNSTNDSCVVTPTETEGPYRYAGGEINNPLQRSDVTEGQAGLPLSLTLTVIDINCRQNMA